MPRYDWLAVLTPLNNPERRKKDRGRKRRMGRGRKKAFPLLATYHLISKHRYMDIYWYGDYKLKCYRLDDLAAIYGLSPATIHRWRKNGMLPPPYTDWMGKPLYVKEQMLAICTVLNALFAQDIRQFRSTHVAYIDAMWAGDEMVKRRLAIKNRRAPSQKVISHRYRYC